MAIRSLIIVPGLKLSWNPGATDIWLHAEGRNGPQGALALTELEAPIVRRAFLNWAYEMIQDHVNEQLPKLPSEE